jgi:hypothetical protein
MADLILTGVAEGPCGCCAPPETCQLILGSDNFASWPSYTPFSDSTDATAALATAIRVANPGGSPQGSATCQMYFIPVNDIPPGTITQAHAIDSSGLEIYTKLVVLDPSAADLQYITFTACKLTAGTWAFSSVIFTGAAPSGSSAAVIATVTRLNGDVIDSFTLIPILNTTEPSHDVTIPADDQYLIKIEWEVIAGTGPGTGDNITDAFFFVSNGVDSPLICDLQAAYSSGMDTLFVDCT